MNVLGICGSPRRASTELILKRALEIAAEYGDVTTQFENIARTKINPCIHCNRCLTLGVFTCLVFPDDGASKLYQAVRAADVLILATPVYQMAPSAQITAFMNRMRPLGKLMSQGEWSTKTGVAIAVGGERNGGQEAAIDTLNRFFMAQGMCIAAGGVFSYSGAAIWSQDSADLAGADEIGAKTLAISVRRAVITAKLLQSGRKSHPELTGPMLAGFKNDEERLRYTSAFRKQAHNQEQNEHETILLDL